MKKEDLDKMKQLIEDVQYNMDYTHCKTADCIEVMAKAIKHIGKRLEILEEHIFNDDRDEEYLN